MDESIHRLKELLDGSDNIVFFGGAGVSTESGIPDFRSVDGLYSQKFKYPPETILSHTFFERHTEEFFDFYRTKMLAPDAQPNAAHRKLAQWEQEGRLKAVITQNIDGLHQKAGSREVLELHGSVLRNYCTRCGKFYGVEHIAESTGVPRCACGGVIKPDVVLYEEPLDENVMIKAIHYIRQADVLLIGEVWESAGHWLQGDMFDSTMNYDFRKHCNLFFAEQSIDASDFAGRITDMLMRYRMQMTPAQMNLLDSHDVSRFLSLCGGDMRRYRLAILFMMTFVGMPTVFYGDELGVQGLSEEEYRCPMPWDNENSTLCTFFKEAIAMRKKLEPLRCGDFRVVSAERGSGLIIYAREYCNQRVTICINRGGKAADLDEEYGKLHWSEGLDHRKLYDHGFAVFVDGQC